MSFGHSTNLCEKLRPQQILNSEKTVVYQFPFLVWVLKWEDKIKVQYEYGKRNKNKPYENKGSSEYLLVWRLVSNDIKR